MNKQIIYRRPGYTGKLKKACKHRQKKAGLTRPLSFIENEIQLSTVIARSIVSNTFCVWALVAVFPPRLLCSKPLISVN